MTPNELRSVLEHAETYLQAVDAAPSTDDRWKRGPRDHWDGVLRAPSAGWALYYVLVMVSLGSGGASWNLRDEYPPMSTEADLLVTRCRAVDLGVEHPELDEWFAEWQQRRGIGPEDVLTKPQLPPTSAASTS